MPFHFDDGQLSFRGARSVGQNPAAPVLQRRALVHTTQGLYPQYEPSIYVVQEGDTPSGIAESLGLDQRTLVWANESLVERSDLVKVGQELVVLPLDGAYHLVAEGESLQAIAEKYHVSLETILAYPGNSIEEPDRLTVGARLIVPGALLPDPPPRVIPTVVPVPVNQVYEAKVVEPNPGSGALAWPLNGLITQRYSGYHPAIDIHTKSGVPVTAADGGTVVLVSWLTYSYGYHIIIDHGNGLETLYAHLSTISVEAGQQVSKGDVVGAVGSTGRSTGPHLHFEVRENGVQRNPFSYLP